MLHRWSGFPCLCSERGTRSIQCQQHVVPECVLSRCALLIPAFQPHLPFACPFNLGRSGSWQEILVWQDDLNDDIINLTGHHAWHTIHYYRLNFYSNPTGSWKLIGIERTPKLYPGFQRKTRKLVTPAQTNRSTPSSHSRLTKDHWHHTACDPSLYNFLDLRSKKKKNCSPVFRLQFYWFNYGVS